MLLAANLCVSLRWARHGWGWPHALRWCHVRRRWSHTIGSWWHVWRRLALHHSNWWTTHVRRNRSWSSYRCWTTHWRWHTRTPSHAYAPARTCQAWRWLVHHLCYLHSSSHRLSSPHTSHLCPFTDSPTSLRRWSLGTHRHDAVSAE